MTLMMKSLPLEPVDENLRTSYLLVQQSRVVNTAILSKQCATPVACLAEVKVAFTTLWALIGTHDDGLLARPKDFPVPVLVAAIATMN